MLLKHGAGLRGILTSIVTMTTDSTTAALYGGSSVPPATTMKAIVYGTSDDPIRMVEDSPVPSVPKKDRVLVRVHAVGLNPVDAKDVWGDKLPQSWTGFRRSYRNRFLSDKIIGFDFAGTVVGDSTSSPTSSSFASGDRVFGTMPPFEGTLVEYVAAPVDQICYMPKSLSFVEAAALPLVGLTALQALRPHISAERRASVLVIGASGGTGHLAVRVAKALGAKHVTAVCSARSADFCKTECGADAVVDYNQNPDELLEDLKRAGEGQYDFVLDCVTSADPRDQQMRYPEWIQKHADVLFTSNYVYRRLGGPSPDWIRAGLERTVGVGCWNDRHEKLFWIRFPRSAPELRQLQEWIEAGALKPPHVSQLYEFTAEDVRKAFDAILSRRVKGKVVVQLVKDEGNDEGR